MSVARNRIHIEAPPERVFATLSDPERYADWVVGSATVDRHDPGFPAPGTRFYHRVGLRPLALADYTDVVAAEPPRRLELRKPTSLALAAFSRMNQGGTDRPAEAGALREGRGAGEVDGGRGGRGSLLVRALKGWDGLLRRAGTS